MKKFFWCYVHFKTVPARSPPPLNRSSPLLCLPHCPVFSIMRKLHITASVLHVLSSLLVPCSPCSQGHETSFLLYSWRFYCYSLPFHSLVYGHMTYNNETVSRQMPWAGNVVKTITSNGKQFTVTRKSLPLLHVIRGGLMLALEYRHNF